MTDPETRQRVTMLPEQRKRLVMEIRGEIPHVSVRRTHRNQHDAPSMECALLDFICTADAN